MPQLTIDHDGTARTVEVPDGERLVLAIEAQGVQIGHRCGGFARCTTCRVAFVQGEPQEMTRAEHFMLRRRGLLGQVRLSCQIAVDRDMAVRPLMTVETEGWPDAGPPPGPTVTPDPMTHAREHLDQEAVLNSASGR